MRILESDVTVVGPEDEARVIAQLIRLNSNASVNIAATESRANSETIQHWLGYTGHFDNFTRLATAHGRKFAEELWQMSVLGLEVAPSFLKSLRVQFQPLKKLRLIRSEHELDEARQAVDWMKNLPCAEYIRGSSSRSSSDNFWNAQNFQRSEANGIWCSAAELTNALRQTQGEIIRLDGSARIDLLPGESKIIDGKLTVRSELIVLLGKAEAVSLFPELEDILIEFGEKWLAFDRPGGLEERDQLTIANHGNIWSASISDRMMLGGARYLQDLTTSNQNERDSFIEHMKKIAGLLSSSLSEFHNLSYHERKASYPCDELPVAGPYHSNHRVILIQGFWGWGFNMLLSAGLGVAGLVSGKNNNLPRRLWPERLRSL